MIKHLVAFVTQTFELTYIECEEQCNQSKVKIRVCKTLLESIFMYTSELWTVKVKLENSIGAIQRNILRKILNVKGPNKIINQQSI